MNLPSRAWSKSLDCIVEIISTGHFPTTVVVRLPNGEEVETDANDLVKIDKTE